MNRNKKNKIKNQRKFDNFLSSKKTLIISIILLLAMEILFNFYMPLFKEQSSHNILDVQLLYSPNDAYLQISQYGQKGIEIYNIIQIIDIFFPLAYGIALMSAIKILYNIKNKEQKKFHKKIHYIPLVGVCMDYFENIFLFFSIIYYQKNIFCFPLIASIFGLLKFIVIGVSMIIIIRKFMHHILGSVRN